MDLTKETIKSLTNRYKNKEIKIADVIKQVYENIENNSNNAFINIYKEDALKKAVELDYKIEKGEKVGNLVGIPVAVKDNICVDRMKTTCGSRMLEEYISPFNADVIDALLKEDAIIIGKTNMDEFGMGSTSETSDYGPVVNMYNKDRVVGGSSGGSAAALVANECIVSLGTDTGGSIRQPAAYMGLVGIKPTYGLVSRYGLVAYASSFDTIGPLAKNVEDAAYILDVIARYDEKDGTSVRKYNRNGEEISNSDKAKNNVLKNGTFNNDVEYLEMKYLNKDIKGMKIAIPKEYMDDNLDIELKEAIYRLKDKLIDMGAIVEEVSMKMSKYVLPTYYVLACAQASSNLARYDGVKYGHRANDYEDLHHMYRKSRSEGFGKEVKRRIMLGNYVLSKGYYEEYYLKALKTKELIEKEYKNIFEKYDVICAPVVKGKAPYVGESLKNPLNMYKGDIYTTAVNIAGVPAITLSIDTDSEGLPIGVQFIANHFEECKMIQIAHKVEQEYKK